MVLGAKEFKLLHGMQSGLGNKSIAIKGKATLFIYQKSYVVCQ